MPMNLSASLMPNPTTATATTLKMDKDDATAVDFPSGGDVAIYWDFENVCIPAWCPTSTATEGIRNKVAKYGRIVEKRLYYDSRQAMEHAAPRTGIDLSGFTLVDCPSRNGKETLDKKLIVDVLCFAWERASMGSKACVVLITSDGDYSYAVARLRDMGVFTVIIYRADNVAKVLVENANVVMSWEYDVLGGPPAQMEEETSTIVTFAPTTSEQDSNAKEGLDQPNEVVIKQPNQQAREKFALFCSAVLNEQHRNVKEGISVYSSWANEANAAATFYTKLGDKDREGYLNIRTLATQKCSIEWGRRNLSAPGKPVIKVRNRDERADGLSSESYLRLTYSGLALLKPDVAVKDSDLTMVLPKPKNGVSTGNREVTSVNPSTSSLVPSCSKSLWKSNKNLFVGALAWQTTEDSLLSYFRQFGPLEKVVVMNGRGFGFIFFRNAKHAEAVLKMAGEHVVDKKVVDVKPYDRKAA